MRQGGSLGLRLQTSPFRRRGAGGGGWGGGLPASGEPVRQAEAGTQGVEARPDPFPVSRGPLESQSRCLLWKQSQALPCLRPSPTLPLRALSSLTETQAEVAVEQEGGGGGGVGLWLQCPLPGTQGEGKWPKLDLTSKRPGSEHSGISMGTQQCRTRWGWERRSSQCLA